MTVFPVGRDISGGPIGELVRELDAFSHEARIGSAIDWVTETLDSTDFVFGRDRYLSIPDR